MSKTALVVEFQIKPGRRDEFVALIRKHAAASLQHSDGCLQFDVLVPKEQQFDAPSHQPDPDRVILFEMYRDEAAFQVHVNSQRVANTRASYKEFVVSRKIYRCAVQ